MPDGAGVLIPRSPRPARELDSCQRVEKLGNGRTGAGGEGGLDLELLPQLRVVHIGHPILS
jgi:hypothetical protein